MQVRLGQRMGALVSDSPRPEDPHPDPLPRGEGGRAAAALRTPGVYKSLRRRRAGVPVRVAGDVARLLGPAATLSPTLSLKGEGGRGGSVLVRRLRGRPLTLALSRRRDLCLTGGGCPEDPHPNPLPRGEGGRAGAASEAPGFCRGLPGERPLRNPGLVARKTPHRFRPKTPESFGKLRTGSASRLGEGKNRRPWTKRCPRAVVVRGASTGRPLTLTLSPQERGKELPCRCGLLVTLRGCSGRQPPSPQPSPSREREEEAAQCGFGGCAEDPSP